MQQPKSEELETVGGLSEEELERLSSRMREKLPKRRSGLESITIEEALALQMELEDEYLEEWRENLRAVRAKSGDNRTPSDKSAGDLG